MRHRGGPVKTFYHSIQPTQDNNTMTKSEIHNLAILYTRGPVKKFSQNNTIPQNKTTKKDNATQTVGFHLQGLQIVAFV